MSTTFTGGPNGTTSFEVFVSKDTFKFTAAHFVAYKGFRERLHGHNYKVSVKLLGSKKIGPDGYVLDFGCIKDVTKKVCKDLNEHFLCPTLSNVIEITTKSEEDRETVELVCEDGARFEFPLGDCAMLPIVHATTEELAIYLYGKILEGLSAPHLRQRGIHTMEVSVAEAIGQHATFRLPIPTEEELQSGRTFSVKEYIMKGEVAPMPCLPSNRAKPAAKACKDCVDCQLAFLDKLQKLALAINNGSLNSGSVTAEDLQGILLNKEAGSK